MHIVPLQAALYGKLAAEVLGRHAAGRHDEQSLKLSARLLELNPEVYTVWNYRKDVSPLPRACPGTSNFLLAMYGCRRQLSPVRCA